MRLLLITMGFLVLASGYTRAEDNAATLLAKVRSLECHFGPGTVTQWKNGKAEVTKAPNDQTVHFDSIDLRGNKARLIGTVGAGDVKALWSPVGMTFIESGLWVFASTTVYAAFSAPEEFLAIDTRHGLIAGTNVTFAEEYPGTCKVFQ